MKTSKLTKILSLLVVLSMMLCMMSACGSGDADTTVTQAASVVADNDDLSSVDEGDTSAVADSIVIYEKSNNSLAPWGTKNGLTGTWEVYEMLYTIDASGERYPVLADASRGEFGGYDHEEGSTSYTFYIYDYIYDHAGNHLTASDVAFCFEYQYNNADTSGWCAFTTEVVDDTTLIMDFEHELTGVGEFNNIICRQFIATEAAFNADGNAFANTMCGTGPYKFVSYEPGVSYTIEINEDYWQKEELIRQESAQNVQTITYYMQEEESQRIIALETGTMDIAPVTATGLAPFTDGGEYADDFQIYAMLSKLHAYITANCDESSPCSDVNLRLAVYNAIDLDGLATVLGTGYEPANMFGSSYYYDYAWVDWDSMDNYNTKDAVDSEVVQGYLDAAGYNGESLEILTIAGMSTAGEVIVNMLAAQGITAHLNAVDQSTVNALAADPTNWDLMLGQMAGDELSTVWSHGFDAGNNEFGAQNFCHDDEWQALLDLCTGSEETHTAEALTNWWQYAVDNAYVMGLYNNYEYYVIPASVSYVQLGDKQAFLPGGCMYTE